MFFAWQLPLSPQETQTYFSAFGFVPQSFFGQFPLSQPRGLAWEWCTVYTSMFSHGDAFHLLGNMLFSTFSETTWRMRWGKQGMEFLPFLRTNCRFGQGLADPDSPIPMVGASARFQESWPAIFFSIHGKRPFLLLVFIFIGSVYLPAYCSWAFGLSSKQSPCPNRCSKLAVAIAATWGFGRLGHAFFKRPGVRMFQSGYSRPFSRNIQKMR